VVSATRWWLAPLTACLAAAIHFGLNVPGRLPDPPPPPSAAKPKAAPAPKPPKPAPRSDADLARLLETWSSKPIDEEPVDTVWGRKWQGVVGRAVTAARKAAFAGSPDEPHLVLRSSKCHTVRCRLEIAGGTETELELLLQALRTLQVGGKPLWRAFAVLPDAPGEAGPARVVIASLSADGIDGGKIAAPGAGAGGSGAGAGAGSEPEAGGKAGAPPKG
jgi:hypothetical protein